MDIRKVKKLIELMEESDLAEIEVKEGEDSVRISRAKTPTSSWVKADDSRLKEINSSQTRSGEGITVNAPMVGSFYRAVSPSSPPFVEVGDIQVLSRDNTTDIGVNEIKVKILFNITQDPNTLDSVTLDFNSDISQTDSNQTSGEY